jgi:hypothetical protein
LTEGSKEVGKVVRRVVVSQSQDQEEEKSAYEKATMAKISKCKEDIERVRKAAGIGISPGVGEMV